MIVVREFTSSIVARGVVWLYDEPLTSCCVAEMDSQLYTFSTFRNTTNHHKGRPLYPSLFILPPFKIERS